MSRICFVGVTLSFAISLSGLATASASALQVGTPLIPHNNPQRVIPSEPIQVVPNEVDPDWLGKCTALGTCADFGAACLPGGASTDGTGLATWCDGPGFRGECDWGWSWCTDVTLAAGCGQEWSGVCLNNGLVSPNSIVPTGRNCGYTGCTTP